MENQPSPDQEINILLNDIYTDPNRLDSNKFYDVYSLIRHNSNVFNEEYSVQELRNDLSDLKSQPNFFNNPIYEHWGFIYFTGVESNHYNKLNTKISLNLQPDLHVVKRLKSLVTSYIKENPTENMRIKIELNATDRVDNIIIFASSTNLTASFLNQIVEISNLSKKNPIKVPHIGKDLSDYVYIEDISNINTLKIKNALMDFNSNVETLQALRNRLVKLFEDQHLISEGQAMTINLILKRFGFRFNSKWDTIKRAV